MCSRQICLVFWSEQGSSSCSLMMMRTMQWARCMKLHVCRIKNASFLSFYSNALIPFGKYTFNYMLVSTTELEHLKITQRIIIGFLFLFFFFSSSNFILPYLFNCLYLGNISLDRFHREKDHRMISMALQLFLEELRAVMTRISI